MWTDWHSDVRSAAAQALAGTGQTLVKDPWSTTGQGLVIHDSLLDRMTHSSPMVRRDAVRRLGQLGQWFIIVLIDLAVFFWVIKSIYIHCVSRKTSPFLYLL